MPLLVPCVKCQRQLKVKHDLAGKTVRCPYCDSSVLVPAVSNPEAPLAERAGAERSGAGRATRTNSPPPPSSHEAGPVDDELAGVVMIPRKLHSRGALGRAFDSVWAALSARRRELGVGTAILVVLLVLQFGWDFWGGPRPAARPQAAAANEPSDAEATETSSAAIVNGRAGESTPADSAAEATPEQSETTAESSEKRAQLHPLAKAPATAQTTPQKSAAKPSPAKSPAPGEVAAEKSSAEATAEQPAAGASRKSASPRPPVAHKGSFTVENPPQVGEIVVVRLKDGLHVAKVTSVDLSELHCEVTVIDSVAYNKGGTIRETKRIETVRFGQLRVPTHPKAKPSGPFGPGGPAATM